MEDIEKHIRSFERVFGCRIGFHDYDGRLVACSGALPLYHVNRFCDLVKRTRAMGALCCVMEVEIVRQRLARSREPAFKTCHAGVSELAVPLFHDGALTAVMFVGPFKRIELPPGRERLTQKKLSPLCPKLRRLKAGLNELPPDRTEDFLNFAMLLAGVLEKAISESDESLADAPPEQRMRRFIDREFRRHDLYLSDMASFMGISQPGLCQMLKRLCGKTFSELLAARRMEHARRLLKETFLKTEFIASECGYRDAGYFYRVFKRENSGLTPSNYRREFQSRSLPDSTMI